MMRSPMHYKADEAAMMPLRAHLLAFTVGLLGMLALAVVIWEVLTLAAVMGWQ